MTKPNPLNEQEKADLVAFLDGELNGEAAHALEAKLSLDPAARAEAESLKRTWGLLDYLPKPEPSPNFTHRTLEKMAPIPTGDQYAVPTAIAAAVVDRRRLGGGGAGGRDGGYVGVGWTGGRPRCDRPGADARPARHRKQAVL